MRQMQLTEGRLLNAFGKLNESGYATSLIKTYDRRDVRVNKLRVKETDCYYIANQRYGIVLKISDNSYMGIASVSFVDFEKGSYITKNLMSFMPNGKLKMPSSSKSGNVAFRNKKVNLQFIKDGKKRYIKCYMSNFNDVVDFECDIELFDEDPESMVIASPFLKKKYFYYGQKINCMRAKGEARIGGRRLFFSPQDSFATLDWSRGAWTYKNKWYWASLSSAINGKKIGFNIGYGIGQNVNACENMLYYDGKAIKIGSVKITLKYDEKGKEEYLKEWKIKASDDSLDLTFTPIVNRKDVFKSIFVNVQQNQVYGYYNGVMRINNKEIQINNLIGLIDKVISRS